MQDGIHSRLLLDRRTFLKTAALATASGSFIDGLKGFAEPSLQYRKIAIPAGSHPALLSAARILAKALSLQPDAIDTYHGILPQRAGVITFTLKEIDGVPTSLSGPIERDGYAVLAKNHGLLVCGARPRSLLFAAGEPHHWLNHAEGIWVRSPDFALRCAGWHQNYSAANLAAMSGANLFFAPLHASVSLRDEMPEVYAKLHPEVQQRLDAGVIPNMTRNAALVKEFHDADLTIFAELPYGNNFSRWSPELYEALLSVYPTAKGVHAEQSWEKAALCPSDPATWRIFDAYVRECARQSQADGVAATFWDQYGMYCQDPRCKANGLDHFKNELYESISHYYSVVKPLGMQLHLRTWSSGCPHWFGNQYVHAPGYGQFSESHYAVWSRVATETPSDILMQTKVYHSDCEPDPPFSTMLGKCGPHTEIVEYQIVGQTIGRQYFPASIVSYMSWTMKKALSLIGNNGGVEMGAGGTMQTNYDVFADILNNCKIYAWRELSWNVNVDLNAIWHDWSHQIYPTQAAPYMARAMQLSEDAVYKTFSPLGFGSSTNSEFAGSIDRRETLLRYTNRNYLPEYTKYLQPTKENIDLIVTEKKKALNDIDLMFEAIKSARPYLSPSQSQEIETRFDWFRQFAICNVTLDMSLWRFRYIRALSNMLTTDPAQLEPLAEAWDTVAKTAPLLFRYQPSQRFTCYDVPLGQLHRQPALGSPLPLMRELYSQSLYFMQQSVGPTYLPKEFLRTDAIKH